MDFKDTLNLPDPDFTIPMKADLPVREVGIQEHWDKIDLYGLVQSTRRSGPSFVFHDGPPYTNSPIHIGTGFNKILKDFAVKSRIMMGYRVPFVPGFDNHGLPIEQAVSKKFAESKTTPTNTEFRRACRDHARFYIELQTKQFKRLGILALWDKPYMTMDFAFEAEIVRVFKRLVAKGFVYRGLRPTLWSPTAQTALADTEIVYQDVTSKAIMVRFPIRPNQDELPDAIQGLENVFALIWTTTPWTIPANLGLAFHPEHIYDVVSVAEDYYLVVHQLVEKVAEVAGWGDWKRVGSFTGKEIERVLFKHPVFERDSLAVLADYVTTEDGTGIVHTAPGHGRDDFFTGQRYGLEVLCPVDTRGILTAEAGEFAGVHYKKCDSVVVERLRELGNLVSVSDFTHSYPHAERDGMPVIYRATEQWFVQIDKDGLRERMLDSIDQKVEWFPRSGHSRIRSMIAGRPDWCVSRQRPWGVGIPVFYGAESGIPVLDEAAMEAVAQLVQTEGSDAWYERSAAEILPHGFKHPETGETEFRKETDVFDVWFDSGSTHLVVLEGNVVPEWKEELPADLYFEGSDQHRGWFNTSLILGTAIRGQAPYRQVVTHGFVNDEKGQKMSKRLGNVIDPLEVCDKFGADILRYWAASVDYTDDVPCGDNLLKVAGEGYRRIRNTLRFLLGNLYDYRDTEHPDLSVIDQWMLDKTDELVVQVLKSFRDYDFNAALTGIHNFCVNEVSAFYGDSIKDRMYCDGADWPSRRAAQFVCLEVLTKLTKLVATILPHTAEEVYSKIPGTKKESVFLDHLEEHDTPKDKLIHQKVEVLLTVRKWVFTEFEIWKQSAENKDSQDIEAVVTLPHDEMEHLLSFGDDLPNYFKMANITLVAGQYDVTFQVSSWLKCARSRLRRADVAEVDFRGQRVPLSDRDRRAVGL